MSKFKLVNLFDKIFITCAVFLIVFAWINFFIRDLFSSFFMSLIFSFGIVYLIFFLFNKKQAKAASRKKYLQDIDENFLAFRLMSKPAQLNLLNNILNQENTTRILHNGIIYKNENKTHKVLIATNIEIINNFQFINLIQDSKNHDFIHIICNDYDRTINTKILEGTLVDFVTKKTLYDDFFLKFSSFPDRSILNLKNTRPQLKEIVKNFIAPNKAKSYFFCGLILIFSSIILPYHFYYLIFGSTLLTFSVLCKLSPLFKH